MVQESQRGGRFQHHSARQFHAVARILGLDRENLAEDLAEHHACLELPPGEDATADVRLVDLHELGEPVTPRRPGFLGASGLRGRRPVMQKMCILWERHGVLRRNPCSVMN